MEDFLNESCQLRLKKTRVSFSPQRTKSNILIKLKSKKRVEQLIIHRLSLRNINLAGTHAELKQQQQQETQIHLKFHFRKIPGN